MIKLNEVNSLYFKDNFFPKENQGILIKSFLYLYFALILFWNSNLPKVRCFGIIIIRVLFYQQLVDIFVDNLNIFPASPRLFFKAFLFFSFFMIYQRMIMEIKKIIHRLSSIVDTCNKESLGFNE